MPNYQTNTTSLPAIVIDATEIATKFQSQDLSNLNITPEDLVRWKAHYAPDAPIEDFMKFIEKCIAYGVDPRRNRAYIVGRTDKQAGRKVYTFQMSIEGLLFQAQKTNEFEGFTDIEYCDKYGKWHDIWLKVDPESGKSNGEPLAFRVGIWRKGFRQPLIVKRYMDEIKPKFNSDFWARMPLHMGEKCTYAKAIRLAFEDVAGGVFIPEEMEQANFEKRYIESIPQYDMVDPASEDAKTPTGYGEPAQISQAKPEPEVKVVESSAAPASSQAPQTTQEENVPSERQLKEDIAGLGLTINRAPATLQQVLENFFPNRDVSQMLHREWTYAESRHVHLKIEEIKAKREAKKKAA